MPDRWTVDGTRPELRASGFMDYRDNSFAEGPETEYGFLVYTGFRF